MCWERAMPVTMNSFTKVFVTTDLSKANLWQGEWQLTKRLTKREKKELKRKREENKPRRNSR